MTRLLRKRLLRSAAGALCAGACVLLLAACEDRDDAPDYVARVGSSYLTRQELTEALASLPARQDSTEAAHQVIEQWVTNQLLYQEAVDRGLDQEPEVRDLLEESERSVLVSALVSRLYEEQEVAPSPAEMQAYFERHKEQLRLLEPFVRVRYLAARDADAAAEARQALATGPGAPTDSAWAALVDRYAVDPEGSRDLAGSYYPESRLFVDRPALRAALARLDDGQTAPVVPADSLYHVVQLAERIPAGTIPQPEWIEDELMRRLLIQSRKQMYARQVQRLRNEALAREVLEIR